MSLPRPFFHPIRHGPRGVSEWCQRRSCLIKVVRFAPDTVLQLQEHASLAIIVHRQTLDRYCALPDAWRRLQDGVLVASRAPRYQPGVLFRAGHASPMTCGRVVAYGSSEWFYWHIAGKSGQWICPTCYNLYSLNYSATHAEYPPNFVNSSVDVPPTTYEVVD